MKLKTRWIPLTTAVYENMHGDRVHILGCVRKGGVTSFPSHDEFYKFLRLHGGNRKRALMGYCEALA